LLGVVAFAGYRQAQSSKKIRGPVRNRGARMFLGIDVSHTAVEAVLFDLQGNEIEKGSERVLKHSPKTGYYETSMQKLWSETAKD
jgi:glycerol kinase